MWIDGASGFGPGEYASSPHGCQARILEAVGEPVSYDELLVYSAFAFRIGVHEAMCPSAGHPCCGYMCTRIADECMRDLPSSWDLAPGPGRAGDWTRDMREEQIKRLEAARIRDRAAIESITRALDHLP